MVFSTTSLWCSLPTLSKVEETESKATNMPQPGIMSRPTIVHDSLPHTTTETSSDTEDESTEPRGPNLLDLPLEIRLQIYNWLLLLGPLKHAQLAPWYPTPTYSAYYVGFVKPSRPASDCDDEAQKIKPASEQPAPKLLCPDRPICGLPTALLQSSRQIYEEARLLPFEQNEFVFVNWFSSGLWAARAFTRPLSQWQKDATRYIRIELLARDFTGAGLQEWVTLCEAWSANLRGLRLKILIGGGIIEPAVTFAELNGTPEHDAMNLYCDPEPRPAWIREGLEKLRSITNIEVELASLDWDCDKKIEWCAALEKMLDEDLGRQQKVKVSCVAKLPTAALDTACACTHLGGVAHPKSAHER
ncbi:hypothetical protein F5X68DRAFT_57793 [Plectosphaerella plurivora]|uniref:Uncharacterized protein n=1 Tax=Plectosphaerella plurivora TaxID=936078 RepID=A0A9P9AE13_9PEZI|nr:hypothetical protein F5X68DRAFT_57793 [Plectosphaerella plurivora]